MVLHAKSLSFLSLCSQVVLRIPDDESANLLTISKLCYQDFPSFITYKYHQAVGITVPRCQRL